MVLCFVLLAFLLHQLAQLCSTILPQSCVRQPLAMRQFDFFAPASQSYLTRSLLTDSQTKATPTQDPIPERANPQPNLFTATSDAILRVTKTMQCGCLLVWTLISGPEARARCSTNIVHFSSLPYARRMG